MPDRISEKSYAEQGLDEVSTQHEGVDSQRDKRKEWNEPSVLSVFFLNFTLK